MSLLKATGLRASYGQVDVLLGIDIEVNEGEMVVVLGANGAGKTTTMRAISGTIPRSGSVMYDGHDIVSQSAESIVRSGIAHVPQGRGTFSELTVEENLRIGAYVRKDSIESDIARWYKTFPRLEERKNQRAGSLSGGEQQRVAIARALSNSPLVILADEATGNLDSKSGQEILSLFDDLNAQGKTLVFVTHDERMIERATRVIRLKDGLVELDEIGKKKLG
jgi:branched-chain amino acid transport system ATP-binding protein